MNIEDFRAYCLNKPHTTEGLPFDENTLVFKVAGKMFALSSLKTGSSANLKCDPERAIELREQYHAVKPGYHMSKVHWNTITFNEDVDDRLFKELIDHSYQLVYDKLPKKVKAELI